MQLNLIFAGLLFNFTEHRQGGICWQFSPN